MQLSVRSAAVSVFDLFNTLSSSWKAFQHRRAAAWESHWRAALRRSAMLGEVREVARLLVHLVAEKDAVDELGMTPLMWAASGGHLPMVKTLLAAGAGHTIRRRLFGGTALHMAAENGHDQVVGALLAGGADKDAHGLFGRTPLMCAAEEGHLPVVKTLLAAGADETAEDEYGQTPADWATCESVRQLLARAPADRAWRRTGGLVMLRSRTMKTSAAGRDGGDAETRPSKRHRGLVMLRATAEKVRTSAGDGGDADLAAVVSDLLSLELEGIFRNVVSFL